MARKRRRAPKYAGALAQRIDVGVDQIDRIEEVLRARLPEKIHLLIKHYKIIQATSKAGKNWRFN